MNNTKLNIIGAIAGIALIGVLWLGFTPAKTPVVGVASYGNTSTDGSQSSLPNPTNYDYLVARLAVGLGTNLSNSNTGAGNINIEGQKMNLTAATTTPCNIQSPYTAGSSTVEAFINITTPTSTSQGIQIATASVPNAFTNVVASAVTVAGGAQASIGVDSIASTTGQLIVVGPSGWVAIGSNSSTALTYGGTCSAVFTTIN